MEGASRLRPLFLAPRLGLGGMTRYLVELAEEMMAQGHAVAIATVDGPGIAQFGSRLRAAGGAVTILPALSRRAMSGAIRAHRADCIKLFTGAFPPDTRISARVIGTGMPMVESIHVLPVRRDVSITQRVFYALRPASRYAMVVFTPEVEAEVRSRIPRLGERVHHLRYGMRLPAPGVHPRSDGVVRFITVCRLDEKQKDVATLLRAFARVSAEWPDGGGTRPMLTIVGDGPDRESLARVRDELRLGDAVEFAGWVEDPIAPVRDADVFVLATHRESPGRVIVEASAVGLPVIASRVEGCTQSVVDGETGVLVSPGDAVSLADAMVSLGCDAELRARLGAAGPAHASGYAIGPHAARIAAVLGSVRGG